MPLNTFPALPLPDEPEPVTPQYAVQEVQFGDGYKQIAEDGNNARSDQVQLSWTDINTTEKDLVVNFIEAHAPATPFYYTSILGTQKVYICRNWSAARTNANFWNISAQLEEYHAA
jgi:phage-related protein